jgi:NAD(P)-dependent dehydrogenase (short-subunit alcohol dehydrogenase family)
METDPNTMSAEITRPDWKKQVAVVTGAARGLGYALARRLLSKGVTVWFLDRDPGVVEAASQLGGNAQGVSLDVTDSDQVTNVIQHIVAQSGRIDILANCAGITGVTNRRSHEVDPDDFARVMSVNVTGCFNTSRAVLPIMLQHNYGRILHVASISGKEGNAGMLAYSTSKAAVIGMTKVQGKEYAETGIRVNAIAPAVIYTDMVAQLPDAQVKYMTDKIPSKRCATVEEFVSASEYILSPENSFTTAFCFDLSGGRATY